MKSEGKAHSKPKRENTPIIFLKRETKEDGSKRYVLTTKQISRRDVTQEQKDCFWCEIPDDFDEHVRLLGQLSEIMEKYGIKKLCFLESILRIFKEHAKIIEYGDDTRNHFLEYYDEDYAYFIGSYEKKISSDDFQRLKIFLDPSHVEKRK